MIQTFFLENIIVVWILIFMKNLLNEYYNIIQNQFLFSRRTKSNE